MLPSTGSCPAVSEIIPDGIQEGFVLGSCQISLFDENFLARQGSCELRLWPFENFSPRMVCQGVCYQKVNDGEKFQKHTLT